MITINADSHPLKHRFHEAAKKKRSVMVAPAAHYLDWPYAGLRQARDLLKAFPAPEFTAALSAQIRHNSANI